MEKINEIFKKIKIFDKAYLMLLESLYKDEELLEKFYNETYLEKNKLLYLLIEKLENTKKRNDAIRKKVFNDLIIFCENRNINTIKDDFEEELNKKGIPSILAYVYALYKGNDIKYYYNIYYNDIKNYEKLKKEVKVDVLAVNINMYRNFYFKYQELLEENKKLKEQNKALNYLLNNIVIDDIEEYVFKEEKKSEKKEKEYFDCVLIGLHKNLAKKYEGIYFINTESIVRYKDKIKNARLVFFDTSKNSHKAYYFSKALNMNIIFI